MSEYNNVNKPNNNKVSFSSILTAIVCVALGVMFCVFRGGALNIAYIIIGGIVIAWGLIGLFTHRVIAGIIEIVFGALALSAGITNNATFTNVLTIIFGAFMIIGAIQTFFLAWRIRSVWGIISALLTLALGVMLIVSFRYGSDILSIFIGVTFMMDGLFALFMK